MHLLEATLQIPCILCVCEAPFTASRYALRSLCSLLPSAYGVRNKKFTLKLSMDGSSKWLYKNSTHILFVEVDHALLKRDIFGLVGFAELLENLRAKRTMIDRNHKRRTGSHCSH